MQQQIKKERLRQAQMRQAQMRQAQMRQAQARQAQMRQAQARQAQMRQAQMRQAQMRQAQMRQAQMRQAQMRQAQIQVEDKETTLLNINKSLIDADKIGFIMLRHVNSPQTNRYWIECYHSIRKFYPENKIMIIDDNSDEKYKTNINMYKTKVINNEYPKRGELMPYIYYLKDKEFDTAVILHDSVFINKYIDFKVDTYKFLWDFDSGRYPQIEDETRLLSVFEDSNLEEFYRKRNGWVGCFGGMSIITHDYLSLVNKKYNLHKLIDKINSRYNRQSFERVIAVLLQKERPQQSLLGDIFKWGWGIRYDQLQMVKHWPIIKIWTGR